MQRTTRALLILLAASAPAFAQLGDGRAHVLLGGGYLEEPGTGYFFGQLGWTFYEDASFAHTAFVEGLFHGDDAELDFIGPGGVVLFSEDADIVFSNITANYKADIKITEPVSLFAGAGAGIEIVSINDHYDESLDDDVNFLAQIFAGVRVEFNQSFQFSVAVRRLFREDFSLLGDQFVTEDGWGLEAGFGFRF